MTKRFGWTFLAVSVVLFLVTIYQNIVIQNQRSVILQLFRSCAVLNSHQVEQRRVSRI